MTQLSDDGGNEAVESIDDLLTTRVTGTRRLGRDTWAFNGALGGLIVALAAADLAQHSEGRPLRNVTAQLLRPVRDDLRITTEPIRRGRKTTVASAVCYSGGEVAGLATAVFAITGVTKVAAPMGPPKPPAPLPNDCPPVLVPVEMVPFAQHVEIRAVSADLPFSGGNTPELIAWIRFAFDESAVDLPRLITLLDGLAPSITATLTTPVAIPTLEYTVHPTSPLDQTSGPWLLIHARTLTVAADGWATERIDAWAGNGHHVGTAHQLRIVNLPTPPRSDDPPVG